MVSHDYQSLCPSKQWKEKVHTLLEWETGLLLQLYSQEKAIETNISRSVKQLTLFFIFVCALV